MLVMALAWTLQAQVGPIEMAKANQGSISVEAEYAYTRGRANVDALDRLRAWRGEEVAFREDPEASLRVQWSSDGASEVLRCYPPSSHHESKTFAIQGKEFASWREPIEVMTDGWVQAEHRLSDDTIQIHLGIEPGLSSAGAGPFVWWGVLRYPLGTGLEFQGIQPDTTESRIGGSKNIVTIYQKKFDAGGAEGIYRLEIHHDPALGYLPRFVRLVGMAKSKAPCKELYLVEARPTAKGGFLPAEYYEVYFSALPSPPLDPSKAYELDAFRPTGDMGIARLRLTASRELVKPVTMTELKNVQFLSAPGGAVPLASKAPLSLNALKRALGSKLTSARPSVAIDPVDSLPPVAPGGPSLAGKLAMAAGVAVFIGLIAWRRKRSQLFALTLLLIAGGCRRPEGEDPLRLEGSFDKTQVVIDQNAPGVPLTLFVINKSSKPVKVFKVDGNCACRAVDQAKLPATIDPGTNLPLSVALSGGSSIGPSLYQFTISTDRGIVNCSLPLTSVARHSFIPGDLGCPTLTEQEVFRFQLTHRAVHEAAEKPDESSLVIPPEFRATLLKKEMGRLTIGKDLKYIDTIYDVALTGVDLGVHKAVLLVLSRPDVPSCHLPVIWRRVPYLSTIPQQLLLSDRPINVLLRCENKEAKFVRVVESPAGVEASITSPRVITVQASGDAPTPAEGRIVMETNDPKAPQVHLPVSSAFHTSNATRP